MPSNRPLASVWTLPAVLLLALVAGARPAAADPEITSDTNAQFYEVRSPTGETVIARRRFTTTLGVSAYDLMPDKVDNSRGPSLVFRARLRYDADYGGVAAETDTARSSWGRLVPGFDRGPVDLMYGYVEGRKFLKGWLGFKLGRQYVTDALGWWSFDGGLVRVTSPYFVAAEIYGGLEQRGGLPLSTPRYERDGVWRGDRTGYVPSLWPAFQDSAIAPAYGFAVESTGLTWLHGRLSYRRVYNTGSSNVTEFESALRAPTAYEKVRVSQDRLGYAMDASLANVGGVKAGATYDLDDAKLANLFASIDGYVSKRLTVSADYEYYVPTFDGDSIWNFFLAMPMNDLGLRADCQVSDRVGIAGGMRGRVFSLQTGPESTVEPSSPNGLAANSFYPSSAFEVMGGSDVAARWRFGEGGIGAKGALDLAKNGRRMGLDVYGDRTLETRYIFQGRVGLWQWADMLRADRDATSVGYVLGAGYKLFPRSTALVEWQHDINRLDGQRIRVMAYLNLAVTK